MIKIPKWLADLGLSINRLYYKQLFSSTYKRKKPPAWFDHCIDLYYHWPHNLFWLERGVFPRKQMFEGCIVLDLFCGDGFYSYYFHSTIAGGIDAIDKDPGAIKHAKRHYLHPKINYRVIDAVKEDFPRKRYDIILWFEGIEHLNETEYKAVIDRVKSAIGDKGILIGSTPLVPIESMSMRNWEHENEFTEVEQLRKFLGSDFAEIKIDTTIYPVLGGGKRRTAYFTVRNPK